MQTHSVGTVLCNDIVGVDDVAARLRHLLAALAEDHAVARTLGIRLLGGDNTDIIQELVPEARVQQVQSRVLHAAVIPVNRRPVFERFLACKLLIIVRIHIAQEVPA